MTLNTQNYETTWKYRNGENVPQLEITEVVLVCCNIVNNQYQCDSRVLCTFVPNESFSQLLSISATNHVYSETFHSEFSFIEEWFTDQDSVLLEIEKKII